MMQKDPGQKEENKNVHINRRQISSDLPLPCILYVFSMYSAENPVDDVEIGEPTHGVDDSGVSDYLHVAVTVLVVVEEVEVDEEQVEGGGRNEEGSGGGVHIESVPDITVCRGLSQILTVTGTFYLLQG